MPPKAAQKPQNAPLKSSKKGLNRKSTPKQPIPAAERLKRLFTSLCAQIEGGHFSNALKTCDKILRIDPVDQDAVKTKLFVLLQTEQYESALNLIYVNKDISPREYEKAYTLYRLHRESESKDILEEIKTKSSGDRGSLHLEAQLNYREGAYQVAFDLYNQLLDTAEPNSEEQSDILTNLQASQQHLEFLEKGFLHALDQLPSNVSANLESHPPPVVSTTTVGTAAPTATSNDVTQPAEPPVKKVRKSRVPAGVIPGVTPPPDPERWLKKSERSTFGQGKRRKGGGGGATQGTASLEVGSGPTVSSNPSKPSGGKNRKKK